MNQKIVHTALTQKNILEFDYNGHHRVVEPHVLGIKSGTTQFLGYQIGGSSSSGKIPEWRRFDLAKVTSIIITSKSFPGKRPFPSGLHSKWDQQIAIVE